MLFFSTCARKKYAPHVAPSASFRSFGSPGAPRGWLRLRRCFPRAAAGAGAGGHAHHRGASPAGCGSKIFRQESDRRLSFPFTRASHGVTAFLTSQLEGVVLAGPVRWKRMENRSSFFGGAFGPQVTLGSDSYHRFVFDTVFPIRLWI